MSRLELVSSLGGSGDSVPIVIITAHDDARLWDDPAGRSWRLTDALSESVYEHDGDEVHDVGLSVDLEG